MFLPQNIGYGLVNLQKFCIQLNRLRALPSSICEMKSLRYLDAHFNALHGLPHAIGRLINLEVLNMSSNFNDLTEVPETIGELINLRELDLSNNQIRALPEMIYQLQHLNKLIVDQNPLVVPPLEVASKGVEAIKEYMMKRRLDVLEAEQKQSSEQNGEQAEAGWVAWGTSLVQGVYSGVFRNVGGNAPKVPLLDQQL